jgi:nucleotide-binding universal stress UspA family protein
VELLYVRDSAAFAPYVPAIDRGDFLDAAAQSFSDIADVRRTVETGGAARIIIERAGADPDTLVAMATHGYSGPARWLLGSVAEKVCYALAGDLLLVRPERADTGGSAELKTMLVPLDFSRESETLLPTLVELAGSLKLPVVLVHVTRRFCGGPPDMFVPAFGATPNLKALWEQDTAEAEKYLSDRADRLRGQGLSHVSTRTLAAGADGPAGEIICLAEQLPGCLIVMTPHGRSGFGRWLMGSVSRRVIEHSKKPLLIVRDSNAPGA